MFTNLQQLVLLGIFVLVTYVTAQENDPSFMKNFTAIKEECAKQYGFSMDYIKELTISESPLPDDDNLKCYYSCINLKIGVLDESGEISVDTLKKVSAEVFSTDVVDEIMENCDVPKEGDLCATAFKMMQCIHKEFLD